jgi:ribonuclease G
MERHENRESVFNAFVDAMKRDKAKNTISHISELGLIQMTRKRVRESLGRILCESCPYCEGKGFVKSPRTLCYEIFRKIKKLAKHGRDCIIVTAHPSVAELLTDEEQPSLEDMENRYNVKVTIKENSFLHQEKYDITVL